MVDTEEVKARNKEAFRQLWDRVNTAYTACGNDDIALENFATSHNDDFRTLYTLKKYADPTLAKHFKQISDRLAWKLGVPPKAVSEFSQHKDINGWEADASGTTMNFPLKAGGIKCHNNLLQKIKKDFAKMAPGYTWKDEWLVGNPPALISIPRPESAALQNFLSGRYLASHANAANTPITSQLAKKVVVDPLFKAWDDYQKKLLAAAESPEAMLTGLCELTFMLPFNLLNECVSGLNSFLKDELAKTGASNTPQNPSAPGTPGNPTPGTPGRNPDPTPGGNPNTDPRIRTVGDAQALVSRLTQIQTFNIALLAELGRMDDPKSQALFKLMNEWLNDSAKPEVLRDPAKEGALKKKQAAATAQLEEMRPFIIKYAQEHGHAALIKMMKTVYPEGTIEDTKTKAQLANIAKGLTPLGHKIEGQTAPDFNQLYDTLKQNTWHGKNTDFQGAYNALELDHQNNALVSAVQRIMANDKLSDSERKKQFQKLMDQSIWTPTDIAAANALIAKLNEQGRLKTPINMKEVKPYGLESSGHEQNIEEVSKRQRTEIDATLNDHLTKGKPLPPEAITTKKTLRRGKNIDARLTERIDQKSGSITLRVDENTDTPYYITYNPAQDIMVVSRGNSGKTIPHASTIADYKNTCLNLNDHYTLIKGGQNPFENGSSLLATFMSLGKARDRGLDGR